MLRIQSIHIHYMHTYTHTHTIPYHTIPYIHAHAVTHQAIQETNARVKQLEDLLEQHPDIVAQKEKELEDTQVSE